MSLPRPPRQVRDPTRLEFLLPPVSLLDCAVFCLGLAPQLLLQAGLWAPLCCVLRALPFLIVRLPLAIARDRISFWLSNRTRRTQLQQPAPARYPSLFEDLVLRCVRWGFVHIEPRVGRVFFSPPVSELFLRFRLGRHALLSLTHRHRGQDLSSSRSFSAMSSLRWREHHSENFKGLWITCDPTRPPDVVIFFVHGGGFVLGSSHFYLEFLLSWVSLLLWADTGNGRSTRFANPAVFSLDYTLAPDAVYPAQLHQALHAYAHVLSTAARGDPTRVVVAGDSAGGAIVLSLLLHLARIAGKGGIGNTGNTGQGTEEAFRPRGHRIPLPLPGLAVLISPWVSLWSPRYRRPRKDYIDVATIADYAIQYVGKEAAIALEAAGRAPSNLPKAPIQSKVDPLMSPGNCQDWGWWRRASPPLGMLVTYGEEEVFAPEIHEWAACLYGAGVNIQTSVDGGLSVHAWPVASLFLARSNSLRFEGLLGISEFMKENILGDKK